MSFSRRKGWRGFAGLSGAAASVTRPERPRSMPGGWRRKKAQACLGRGVRGCAPYNSKNKDRPSASNSKTRGLSHLICRKKSIPVLFACEVILLVGLSGLLPSLSQHGYLLYPTASYNQNTASTPGETGKPSMQQHTTSPSTCHPARPLGAGITSCWAEKQSPLPLPFSVEKTIATTQKGAKKEPCRHLATGPIWEIVSPLNSRSPSSSY